jgi:uncharacterized YigZ family protein
MYNEVGDVMKSIKNPVNHTIEIKRSLFHTYLFPIKTVLDVETHLKALKKAYPDANHYCFGYSLSKQTIQKYDDDGEPSNTAGLPIMEQLKRHDLTDTLCVVVREFGGIKLGGGGLIRAYAKSASTALDLAVFTSLQTFNTFKILLPLAIGGKYESFIRHHVKLNDVIYQNKTIEFHAELPLDDYENFIQALTNHTLGKAQVELIKTFERFV